MAKKILKKLMLGPAVIFSAIIVALLSLLGLINFSTPSFTDSSADQSETQSDPPVPDANALVMIEPTPARVASEADETAALQPMDVVDVLIDGDAYWLGIGRQDDEVQREKRTVREITRACEESVGDETGVRIRVTRTFDATAQAEQTLVEALTAAGLSDDEIDFRRTLVERPGSQD